MATKQDLSNAARLHSIISARQYGYDSAAAAKRDNRDFERLGGEEAFARYLSDPEINKYIAAGSGNSLTESISQGVSTWALPAAAVLAGGAGLSALAGGAGAAGAGSAAAGGFGSTAGSLSPDFVASALGESVPAAGGFLSGGAGYSALPAAGMVGTGGLGAAESAAAGVGASGAAGAAGTAGAGAAGGGLTGTGWIDTLIGQAAGPAISGLLGSSSADAMSSAAQQAANTSAASADRATALQKQIYEETVARQKPWLESGQNALAQMTQGTASGTSAYMKPFGMADYQADPGYSFRMSEGMKALEQGAAARGGLLSGNMLKGAQRYGQDMASQEYQNAFNRYQTNQGNQFNRLASLAGVGQTANSALGQAGQSYAGNVGNIGMTSGANQSNALLAAGQARASSMQGWGNALGGVDWGSVFGSGGGGSNNYASNMGGANTSLNGFYTPAY